MRLIELMSVQILQCLPSELVMYLNNIILIYDDLEHRILIGQNGDQSKT